MTKKPILKISPSTVESFRTCRFGMYGKTMKNFVEGLSIPWEKTMAQSRGDAYHKLLELGPLPFLHRDPSDNSKWYKVPDPDMKGKPTWTFSEKEAAPAIETFENNPDKKHEVWGRLNLDFTNYGVYMPLRVDALQPKVIWDYKTTASEPKKTRYQESVVWPFYMMAFPDCTVFRFRVFQLLKNDCLQTDFLFDKDYSKEGQSMTWLTGLVDFIEKNNLESHFLYQPKTKQHESI